MTFDLKNFDIKDFYAKSFDLFRLGGRKRQPTVDKKYATLNRRLLAITFDSLILMFPMPLINRLFPINTASLAKYSLDSSNPRAAQIYLVRIFTDHDFVTSWLTNGLAQLLLLYLFSAVCWHFWSATPGKMLLRIRIADATTEAPITDRQIALRLLGYTLSVLGVFMGFFWIAFDKHRQGWHDKIAHTVVLVKPWFRQPDIEAPPT